MSQKYTNINQCECLKIEEKNEQMVDGAKNFNTMLWREWKWFEALSWNDNSSQFSWKSNEKFVTFQSHIT